ncbi:hypothetical protein [uncultured Tateyamaria sp.]|uniref:hypothetical protein n=1 Tax=uncultured Tateyamaria sp. TaxID=455651 RepID=UPI00263361AD|nr:hypothetical protein [uncultured Tateyamaria sp.]
MDRRRGIGVIGVDREIIVPALFVTVCKAGISSISAKASDCYSVIAFGKIATQCEQPAEGARTGQSDGVILRKRGSEESVQVATEQIGQDTSDKVL